MTKTAQKIGTIADALPPDAQATLLPAFAGMTG